MILPLLKNKKVRTLESLQKFKTVSLISTSKDQYIARECLLPSSIYTPTNHQMGSGASERWLTRTSQITIQHPQNPIGFSNPITGVLSSTPKNVRTTRFPYWVSQRISFRPRLLLHDSICSQIPSLFIYVFNTPLKFHYRMKGWAPQALPSAQLYMYCKEVQLPQDEVFVVQHQNFPTTASLHWTHVRLQRLNLLVDSSLSLEKRKVGYDRNSSGWKK